MIEAAEDILAFTTGRTRADLDTDRQLAHALARCIEIFGEAAGKTSVEVRRNLPAVSWALAVAMRNRLAHAYFNIDPEMIWGTATREIPRLLPLLRAALADDDGAR